MPRIPASDTALAWTIEDETILWRVMLRANRVNLHFRGADARDADIMWEAQLFPDRALLGEVLAPKTWVRVRLYTGVES